MIKNRLQFRHSQVFTGVLQTGRLQTEQLNLFSLLTSTWEGGPEPKINSSRNLSQKSKDTLINTIKDQVLGSFSSKQQILIFLFLTFWHFNKIWPVALYILNKILDLRNFSYFFFTSPDFSLISRFSCIRHSHNSVPGRPCVKLCVNHACQHSEAKTLPTNIGFKIKVHSLSNFHF